MTDKDIEQKIIQDTEEPAEAKNTKKAVAETQGADVTAEVKSAEEAPAAEKDTSEIMQKPKKKKKKKAEPHNNIETTEEKAGAEGEKKAETKSKKKAEAKTEGQTQPEGKAKSEENAEPENNGKADTESEKKIEAEDEKNTESESNGKTEEEAAGEGETAGKTVAESEEKTISESSDAAAQKESLEAGVKQPENPAGSEEVPAEPEKENEEIVPSGTQPEETETPKEPPHIGRIIARIILGAAVTSVAALGGYYGYGAFYYANHYYTGTTAVIKSEDGSLDCWTEDLSDLTVAEAKERISSYTDDYVLTINSIKGTTDTIAADEIDYHVTEDSLNSLQEVMKEQDFLLWIIHMTDVAKASVDETIDIATEYDAEKLADRIDTLVCVSPDHVEEGKNAYLNYNQETYLYEIVDSVSGNQGDKEKITAKIEEALGTNSGNVELEDADYAQPDILTDDPDLVAKRDEINQYLKSKITVSDNGATIVVDGSVIINFLDIDDDWNVVLDETKIATYVNQNFDAAFDTRGTTRTVNLKNSGEVTMSVGTFGDFVQTTAEVEKLVAEISAGQTVEREPCYYNNYEVEGNGGIGDTYIDVNITQQKVYVVVNNETVLTTDCVTGLTNGTRDTPIGFYYVWWKTTNYTMVTYNSFVYYWMPIDETGVGLHDATWRSSFGGTIYQSNGSHGCINLPKDMAAKIYDIAYVGIPVIVHK